jgi:ADP-ribose pyrophosphatase
MTMEWLLQRERVQEMLKCRTVRCETDWNGDWWKGGRVFYQRSETAAEKPWDFVNRTTTNAAGLDGVDMIPIFKEADGSHSVLIVAQFRPVVGKVCLEFPAGLADEKESMEDAALRELREETGVHVPHRKEEERLGVEGDSAFSVTSSPMTRVNPSGSAETTALVVVESEEAAVFAETDWDEDEVIEVFMVPLKGLRSKLAAIMKETPLEVDAKLFTFAWGVELGMKYQ